MRKENWIGNSQEELDKEEEEEDSKEWNANDRKDKANKWSQFSQTKPNKQLSHILQLEDVVSGME